MPPIAPASQPIEAVPTDGLLSSMGPFDVALLTAGLIITAGLAIGFVLLLRQMAHEPK